MFKYEQCVLTLNLLTLNIKCYYLTSSRLNFFLAFMFKRYLIYNITKNVENNLFISHSVQDTIILARSLNTMKFWVFFFYRIGEFNNSWNQYILYST